MLSICHLRFLSAALARNRRAMKDQHFMENPLNVYHTINDVMLLWEDFINPTFRKNTQASYGMCFNQEHLYRGVVIYVF